MSFYDNYTYLRPIEIEHHGDTFQGLPLQEDVDDDFIYTIIPDPSPTRCAGGTNCAGASGKAHQTSEYRIMSRPGTESTNYLPYCEDCIIERLDIPREHLP